MAATRPAPREAGNVVALPLRAPRLPTGVGPSKEPKAPPVSPVRSRNAIEEARRESKVAYIVLAAGDFARHEGKALPVLIREMEGWSEAAWAELAKAAGQHPPSPTSRAMVLDRLRARAAQETVAPPPAVRFVVVHRPQPGFAYKVESEPVETRAEAEAVLKRRRELTTGAGFEVEAWIEERRP